VVPTFFVTKLLHRLVYLRKSFYTALLERNTFDAYHEVLGDLVRYHISWFLFFNNCCRERRVSIRPLRHVSGGLLGGDGRSCQPL
jgi:hypothetical protein